MILETERLVLRPFEENDAKDVFELLKDDRIGPWCGWPAHTSIEHSRNIIKKVLMNEEVYAITLKPEGVLIGTISIKLGNDRSITTKEDEAELGFWIGVPYWRKGYACEATNELIRRCYEDLNIITIWCAYYKGNKKSKGVQEKCGFVFDHIQNNVECSLLNEIRVEYVSKLEKKNWISQKDRNKFIKQN